MTRYAVFYSLFYQNCMVIYLKLKAGNRKWKGGPYYVMGSSSWLVDIVSLKTSLFKTFESTPTDINEHQELPLETFFINQTNLHSFSQRYHIFLLLGMKHTRVVNEHYVLDQWKAFSHGCIVIISFHFLIQNSEFYRFESVIFASGGSIVSGENSWCPCFHQPIPILPLLNTCRGD